MIPILLNRCLIILALAGQLSQSLGIINVHQTCCTTGVNSTHFHFMMDFWTGNQCQHASNSPDIHSDVPPYHFSRSNLQIAKTVVCTSQPVRCCWEHSRTLQSEFIPESGSDTPSVTNQESTIFSNPGIPHISQTLSSFRGLSPEIPLYLSQQSLLI